MGSGFSYRSSHNGWLADYYLSHALRSSDSSATISADYYGSNMLRITASVVRSNTHVSAALLCRWSIGGNV
ncbi:hypothetical protein VTH82DRAFT_4663 [Thermothelomyces myriococcoides]